MDQRIVLPTSYKNTAMAQATGVQPYSVRWFVRNRGVMYMWTIAEIRTGGADCNGDECRHIGERVHPHPDEPKDWISHKLYWARSGFKDPYSQAEKLEFSKCDAYCADSEHKAAENTNATPSYCNLPILHAPIPRSTPRTGYVSQDGHRFECRDPFEGTKNYHIVFAIDSSSSMAGEDRKPLSNTPISERLRLACNNRYGAVLSALYGFWKSRESNGMTGRNAGAGGALRSDTYSIISFNSAPNVRVAGDASSTTEQLIDNLVSTPPRGGTNFSAAVDQIRIVLESNWDGDHTPVVIFLSDGECSVPERAVQTTCQICIRLGAPLAFYTISFGTPSSSDSLQAMARIAGDAYSTFRSNERNATNPCSYVNAIDSIHLARTFLNISHSLQKPRAALIGSSNNRLPIRG